MKRSNRLVLLIGVLLAVVAFGGVLVLFNQKQAPVSTAPTELPTVYAKQDIPLGTRHHGRHGRGAKSADRRP